MNAVRLMLFTLAVTAFYTYVAQMVPQKEVHPPKSLELRPDMTPEELAVAGREIAGGKGTCLACHTLGAGHPGRFPDLEGVGARAGARVAGLSGLEYLAQSLYEPEAYIVEGYSPGMPAVHKPPISLSDAEILAVVAWLQSLGGAATVTPSTVLRRAGADTEAAR